MKGLRCLALASLAVVPVQSAEQQHALNPIRKVVTLLQSMQKKVQDEGASELALYKKFMCYCKTGGGDLSGSIGASEEKIPAVTSDIEEAEAKLTGAKADLKGAQSDRSAAKVAIQQATALREKEAATFASLKYDHETNIAAINKATAAISKGVVGGFLQTSAAQALRRALPKFDLPESDQEAVSAFLSQSTEYAPQSGQIIGILKQLGDNMAATLADATAVENASIASYQGLMKARSKEVAALTGKVETKTRLIGDLGVSLVRMKEDLDDTQDTLAQDKVFLAELEKSCATKTAEWEERSKTRAEELVALADTIKVLNDDDALELFKKTLPGSSASLLQLRGKSTQSQALAVIRLAQLKANRDDKPGFELLALALAGKRSASTGGFDKVIKMIDNMVALLKKEQGDDDQKKEYCSMQFDSSDDKKKAVERKIAGEESAIAAANEAIATLTQEISALGAGIRALDKSVAEATAQRRDENAEFKALMASDTAAKEVLAFAKNRLNQFYNPKLYKPPANVELSSEDRIYGSMGGELSTAAPSGIAGTGITVLSQVSQHRQHKAAPAAPPGTWKAYAAKSGENNGVIAMMNLLIADLDKEMAEADTDEKNSQSNYEQMMKDSAAKRAADSVALTEKEAAKADTEAALQAHTDSKDEGTKELMVTMKYISSLHTECDWLLKYFDARQQARADEVDSLNNAKAVLSGADYALVQTQRGFLSLVRK